MEDAFSAGPAHDGDDERGAEIYRLRVVNRLTQREIAKRLGISQQRVSVLEAGHRAKLPPVDVEAARKEALERHLTVVRKAAELMEMNGAPVTAGKDGAVVYDPELKDENDNPVVVRDYAGRVAAAKLLLEADREIRKLLGADAATKTEISGGVKYEVVGVDPGELV